MEAKIGDHPYFENLLLRAYEEKIRTDDKHGSKEVGGTNKARLVAIISEEMGMTLGSMRKGDKEGAKLHYMRTLAHMVSLSCHIEQTKEGAQYLG